LDDISDDSVDSNSSNNFGYIKFLSVEFSTTLENFAETLIPTKAATLRDLGGVHYLIIRLQNFVVADEASLLWCCFVLDR